VKRNSPFELATMLLIPVLAIVGALLFLVVASFVVPYDMFGLVTLLFFVGGALGAVLGDYISKTIVKRSRIRARKPGYCYRCKACGKVFLLDRKI
jgi:hypothetical protein